MTIGENIAFENFSKLAATVFATILVFMPSIVTAQLNQCDLIKNNLDTCTQDLNTCTSNLVSCQQDMSSSNESLSACTADLETTTKSLNECEQSEIQCTNQTAYYINQFTTCQDNSAVIQANYDALLAQVQNFYDCMTKTNKKGVTKFSAFFMAIKQRKRERNGVDTKASSALKKQGRKEKNCWETSGLSAAVAN